MKFTRLHIKKFELNKEGKLVLKKMSADLQCECRTIQKEGCSITFSMDIDLVVTQKYCKEEGRITTNVR